MKILVTDPATGGGLNLDAVPVVYKGEEGFRITFEDHSSIVIGCSSAYRVLDGHLMEPELIENICLALREREGQGEEER